MAFPSYKSTNNRHVNMLFIENNAYISADKGVKIT